MRNIATGAVLLALALLAAAPARSEDPSECDMGIAAQQGGNATAAIAHYDRCLAEGELSARGRAVVYTNRGAAYRAKGQYDRAIADYDEAISLSASYAMAYYNRGIAFGAKGQHDRAIADFDKAISLNPSFADAYTNRGVAYRAQGRYDRAIADFDQAIRLNPSHAEALYNRGAVYSIQAQYDRAIVDYDKAIRLKPSYAEAYNSLAWLLASCEDARLRDGARAVDLAQKAVALLDGNPDLVDTLAAAYAAVGRFADAVKAQQDAIALLRKQDRSGDIPDFETRLVAYQEGRAWWE